MNLTDQSLVMTPRRLLSACFRYKWRAMAVVCLVMGAAAAALVMLPREYSSEAKLFVRIGRENLGIDPTATTGDKLALSATRDTEMNSILEHLQSRSLLEKVLDSTDAKMATATPMEREEALRSLQKKLFVDSPRASSVIVLHAEGSDPKTAQTVLASLVDCFLTAHMHVNRSSNSFGFFDEQSKLLNNQVEAARSALRDAKSKAGMASLDGQRHALESQISSSETKLAEIDADVAAIDQRQSSLERSLADVPDSLLPRFIEGTPNDGMAAMRQKLFELQTQEQEILAKFTPSHPSALSIRAQVEEVTKQLEKSSNDREKVIQAVLARDTANRAGLQAQRDRLTMQLSSLNERLRELNGHEVKIQALNNELSRLETQYLAYVERREDARIDDALMSDRITNVSILQPASFSPRPIRPQPRTVLMLAAVVAALAAAGIVIQADQSAAAASGGQRNGVANGSGRDLPARESAGAARRARVAVGEGRPLPH